MATNKATRFFMLFMALLFLGTSSAVVIALAVQSYQDRHKTDDNGATSTPASQNSQTQPAKENKLTGTQMQNFTPSKEKVTKLEVKDIKEGTGEVVKAHDTVTADYVGALVSTGVIFDASADHGGPISFSLDGVIKGWGEGVPGMKVGGTRRLTIPASLGYGAQGSGSSIPPNADLVFDVTVTKIGQ